MSEFFVEQVARLAESGEPVTVELVTSAGGIMTDKKLYDDIRGVEEFDPYDPVAVSEHLADMENLIAKRGDEAQEWQRRAEWLAEQLALAYCKMYESEYDGLQEPDKTADYWLKRAGEEA